ncbi:hypothetical protein [Brevundimonas sp.]|uniref:hypothetical protein n=1 Tax=Brevundimonas sp. TaxID=1871086 RepID=UPI003D0F334C
MFTPPRFVVVDDKPEHLQAIVTTFRSLGTTCSPILYRPEEDFEGEQLRGVRALFMDLNLNAGPVSNDHSQHFATIVGLLEDHITEAGGPFVLVLWTENAKEAPNLIKYIDDNLSPETPWARPVATMGLSKTDYLVGDKLTAEKAEELKDAILKKLEDSPQIAALLTWEGEVVVAASETLRALVGQVPLNKRKHVDFGPALDVVLSRLARAAVGKPNAVIDPRAAVNAVLGPILSDRLSHAVGNGTLWKKALTRVSRSKLPDMPLADQGTMNRMLHLAEAGSEPQMRSSDWGVVSAPNWIAATYLSRLGISKESFLTKVLKVPVGSQADVTLVVVRAGATCDHAQGRDGPVPYYVGAIVPEEIIQQREDVPASEWMSPVLSVPGTAGSVRIAVNARFPLTLVRDVANRMTPSFRIREQLLMQMITAAGDYQSRPGIVQLPG